MWTKFFTLVLSIVVVAEAKKVAPPGPFDVEYISKQESGTWNYVRQRSNLIGVGLDQLELKGNDQLKITDGRGQPTIHKFNIRNGRLFYTYNDTKTNMIRMAPISLPFQLSLSRRRYSFNLEKRHESSRFLASYVSYNKKLDICDDYELRQRPNIQDIQCPYSGIMPGVTHCDVTLDCRTNYVQNGDRAVCQKGRWENVPTCILESNIVQQCQEELAQLDDDQDLETCPVTEDEFMEYMFAQHPEEMFKSEIDESGSAGRTIGCVPQTAWFAAVCPAYCGLKRSTGKSVNCFNLRRSRYKFILCRRCKRKYKCIPDGCSYI